MKHVKHHRLWSGAIMAITIALWAGLTLISESAASGGKTVTFNKDVAPILFKSCAECHCPGEAAPFSVLSYKDARPWARSIREQVVSRQMPPWHADSHVGSWANELNVPNYSFSWQTTYVPKQPIAIPKGTRFLVTAKVLHLRANLTARREANSLSPRDRMTRYSLYRRIKLSHLSLLFCADCIAPPVASGT